MTSRKPSRLAQPALSDFPFISIMFSGKATFFENSDGTIVLAELGLRSKIVAENFTWPCEITLDYQAPLEAMTEETFEGMCSLMKPTCDGWAIDDKSILEYFSQKNSKYLVDKGRINNDQLYAYYFSQASFSQNIHWGKMVDLYNASATDQQEAIFLYFQLYHELDFEKLVSHKAPVIELPDTLCGSFKTRRHEGNDYIFSDDKGKWLRDDRFYRQFLIELTIRDSHFSYLIASAPTLQQAIAKATVYVKRIYRINYGRLEIFQSGVPVVHANIQDVKSGKAGDDQEKSSKLKWNFDRLGCDGKHIAGVKRYCQLAAKDGDEYEKIAFEAEVARLDEMATSSPPIKRDILMSTVLAVEKELGLQWSKVHTLEDELGL